MDALADSDHRSDDYPARLLLKPFHYKRPRSYTWSLDICLDQAVSGGCVGYAWAHELAARPVAVPNVTAEFAQQTIYWNSQRIDRWPGGEYPGAKPIGSGTSVLAAAKVLRRLGFIRTFYWAETLDDLVAAVGYMGPALLGCDWFEGMHQPEDPGRVRPIGRRRGRHCVVVLGVRVVRADSGFDEDASSFLIQNSWGRRWGIDGRCRIAFADIRRVWSGAEVCIPCLRRKQRVPEADS